MVAQQEILWIWMEVDLLVHPVAHRMEVPVMLQPVRSYLNGRSDRQTWIVLFLDIP
jgi:hypothetical protein